MLVTTATVGAVHREPAPEQAAARGLEHRDLDPPVAEQQARAARALSSRPRRAASRANA